MSETRPGRSCPLSYCYAPEALARPAELAAETLWVAGGLYGNALALEALLEACARERSSTALVFNGDFHWFDADPAEFAAIDRVVHGLRATRGNVETELAAPAADAGCGCGYPEWVDDGTVERSNEILERLRAAAGDASHLAALPMHLVAEVGGARVGIVHGDAHSLAGWDFSQEVLATAAGCARADAAFERAGVQIFAASHTCLPVLQRLGESRVLVNNGAAGMPNFRGELYGLATRISAAPSDEALYRVRCGEVFVEAIPLRYDQPAWRRRFLELWPAGSPAHRSYYARIVNGPSFAPRQALREQPRPEREHAEQGERAEHAGR